MFLLQAKWNAFLAGKRLDSKSRQRIEQYQRGMLQGEELLWADVPPADNASDLHTVAVRLQEMAIGLNSPGEAERNSLLAGKINEGLGWLHRNRFNEAVKPYGNWWYWQIGVPIAVLETMLLLGERLDNSLSPLLLRTVDRFVGDPAYQGQLFGKPPSVSTGANLVWKCTAAALSAVLQGNESKLLAARQALLPVFSYTEDGDGFYEDGSFIQHHHYAYTGGYGKALLHDIARLLVWLDRTEWALPPEAKEITLEWVERSFAPLVFRGSMPDMVNGREISRGHKQNHDNGHVVITSILRLARLLEGESQRRLLSKVKWWIAADTCKAYLDDAPPDTKDQARLLLEDSSIAPTGEEGFCRLFARMDRAVLQGKGFAYAVSMHSSRIRTYESINGENLKGWYTGQGMTFLYNGDLGQYADAFWPTVDAYRLPGTTVTDRPRSDGEGQNQPGSRHFVGGAVLQGRYGAVAMEVEDAASEAAGLTGRKSWFLLGDRIVALGSDIGAAAPLRAETIIDNRKLNGSKDNAVIADGDPICRELDQVHSLRPSWLHVGGNAPEAEYGLVFPVDSQVQALREERRGAWREINEAGSPDPISRQYLTLWFDHGQAPREAGYAYVLLPGRSRQETADFARELPIRIVEQSYGAHAVEDRKLGLFAAHYWQNGRHACGPVACSGQASVVLKRERGGWSLAVADPTQLQREPIELEISLPPGRMLAKSHRITVAAHPDKASVRLRFDPAGAAGSSHEIVFGGDGHE